MSNKTQNQSQADQQTSNPQLSLTQPFDTPSLFIKRPIPIKSPMIKDGNNIAHSSRNSSESGAHQSAGKHSRNLNKQFHESNSEIPTIGQRSLSFQIANQSSQNLLTEKENKPPSQNQLSNTISFSSQGAFQAPQELLKEQASKLFDSPQSRRETPSKSYQSAFANLHIGNAMGSGSKYTSNISGSNAQNMTTSDFLKTINQSPMLCKTLAGDWKYSPHITPQKSRGFESLMNGCNLKPGDSELPTSILTRQQYQQTLLSPAPDSNGLNAIDPYRMLAQNKEKELIGKRLFQSPPKFKGSLIGSTRGGTKIYQNRLDDITEEDQMLPMSENLSLYDNTFNPQGCSQNNESDHLMDGTTFKTSTKRPQIMIDEDDANFTTPTTGMESNYHSHYHHQHSAGYQYPIESGYKLGMPYSQYNYRQAQYHSSYYSNNQNMHPQYHSDYNHFSSQKEYENCDKYHPQCKNSSSRVQRSNVIQQLDLSKSNFINSHINIQFPNVPPQGEMNHQGYYMNHPEQMVEHQMPHSHKLRHYNPYAMPYGDHQGFYPIQINTKQKNFSSIKKKSGSRKQDLLGHGSGMKRSYGQFMKNSGKKNLNQQQAYQMQQTSMIALQMSQQNLMPITGPNSVSKSAQKQSYKNQVKLIQNQRLFENTPETNAHHDALLSTPKGLNNQRTPDKISQAISSSNFKTPQILLQSDNKSTQPQKTTCNCKKSKCLKLYCDCFAFGLGCSPECNCSDCANTEGNEERKLAMDSITERNPNAFKPKIQEKGFHSKGCHCKKSGCLKKYCECYQSGVMCTQLCACEGCKNCDENMMSERKMLTTYDDRTEQYDDEKMSVIQESTSKKDIIDFKPEDILLDHEMKAPSSKHSSPMTIKNRSPEQIKKSPKLDVSMPTTPKDSQSLQITQQPSQQKSSNRKQKQSKKSNDTNKNQQSQPLLIETHIIQQKPPSPIKEIEFKPEISGTSNVSQNQKNSQTQQIENKNLKRQKTSHVDSSQTLNQPEGPKSQKESSNAIQQISNSLNTINLNGTETRHTRKQVGEQKEQIITPSFNSKNTANKSKSSHSKEDHSQQKLNEDHSQERLLSKLHVGNESSNSANNNQAESSCITTRSKRKQLQQEGQNPNNTQTEKTAHSKNEQPQTHQHATRSQRKQQNQH